MDHCDARVSRAGDHDEDHEEALRRLLPLSGLTFAAKDNLDVEGYATGCGQPTWLATHPAPAESHAVSVAALLSAGANLVGEEKKPKK